MKFNVIFSDFQWHDLGFFAKILIFLDFLAREMATILVRNLGNPRSWQEMIKNPWSWQEIEDYPRLSKILARKPRRQALSNHPIDYLFQFQVLLYYWLSQRFVTTSRLLHFSLSQLLALYWLQHDFHTILANYDVWSFFFTSRFWIIHCFSLLFLSPTFATFVRHHPIPL